jgi:hypothetical protein
VTARRIDLDAARAARAEKVGPPPVVVLEGVEYELPRELPMEAVLVVAEDLKKPNPKTVRTAMEALFGEHWPTLRPKLSVSDTMLLLTGILDLYGTDLPEREASASS